MKIAYARIAMIHQGPVFRMDEKGNKMELVTARAELEDGSKEFANRAYQVHVVDPLSLARHEPTGGYLMDYGQFELSCLKNDNLKVSDRLKIEVME